jgi:protein Mpv17
MSAASIFGRFFQGALIRKTKGATRLMFNKHLLLTNLGISVGLSVAGDFLQQRYAILKSEDRTYNSKRTFNMGVTGCTIGFLCHYWYVWLDKFLPGRTWAVVGKKV